MMKVLVVNCGSSSVKFQLIEMDNEVVLAKGVLDRIGLTDSTLSYKPAGKDKVKKTHKIPNHNTAISLVLDTLMDDTIGVIKDKNEIDGIGHRLVHGGEKYSDSVAITDKVKEEIKECSRFAPLHNPHNLAGVLACEELLPGIPQIGVFDTAFHQTLPKTAYMYALPMELYRENGIRRYGFHGTSHAYVARQAAEYVGKPIETLKIITCHLGNGASVTAVDGGKSVETSMGFTPLEGLIMGTRCGDIDPALVPYIAQLKDLTIQQVDDLLNKQSGMLALTEDTSDMRDIEDKSIAGIEPYVMANDIYCHRLIKYIGAYTAVLGGLDILVFTAGVGERSPYIREIVLRNLGYLGITFDKTKNEKNAFEISTGKTKVLVIPTNEELAIARDTKRILMSKSS
ncbi:acetate kinase [candidate division KSB1 bacterium]|nr:acetate kinase [candidate division KSB1 bacterium]